MSSSTTQARRGIRGEPLTVLTILLGMLLSLVAVLATAQPAFAATACSGDDNQTDAQRIFLEIDGTTNGTFDGTDYLDSDEDDCSEEGGNDISFDEYSSVIIHISCSENLVGIVFPELGTVTDFWLNSVNNGGQTANSCQPLEDFPDPAEPSGSLVCDEVESGQFSISYTLNKGDSAGPFNLTGPSNVDDLAEASTLTVAVSDAADGAYAITGTDAALTVPDDCSTLPAPAITLVKEAVDGDGSNGSDLADGELAFTEENADVAQTALYSYVITNTGEEPLENISLSDSRDDVVLDMGDCPEVLEVDAFCTATGSEDFTLDKAEGAVDSDDQITNIGTVEADGTVSGTTVDASDDAAIVFSAVFSEVNEKPDPAPEVEEEQPAPEVKSEAQEQPAPEVESAAAELPATGLDREGLLPLSLLLIAMGAAILWLDRPWVGVR